MTDSAPSKTEINIIFFKSLVRNLLVAAGIVKKAMTSIIPTTFIKITTVKAIKHKNKRYKNSVGTPTTLPNSSSKEIIRNSLKNKTIIKIIAMLKMSIKSISEEVTANIFPNRYPNKSGAKPLLKLTNTIPSAIPVAHKIPIAVSS